MGYQDKAGLLSQLEKRMSAEMIADQMNMALRIISDIMEGFEITEKAGRTEDRTDDLLESYLAAMRVEGRSLKTIDRYRYEIGRMMDYVGVSTRKITVYHLRDYIAREKKRGICDTTLENDRQIYSAYFNWLQRESLIERNPAANLGKIKKPKKKKVIYTDVDLEKLKQNCTTARDRAIITFLGATGCRISEAMELNRDSVDLQNLECMVHGKGDKERMVYMDPVAGLMLQEYLDGRNDECEALFIGRHGRRLQPGGARAMLNRVAKAAGIDHVHPHKFRRTLATNLTKHGMPIQEVASILGHEKLDTTMQYVVLDNENTKNAYKRYR